MTERPIRFPKVHSPFGREKDENDNYTAIDSINEELSWVFEDEDFTEESLTVEEEHLSGGNYRKYTPRLAKLRRDMFSQYHSGNWPMTEYGNH